MDNLEEYTLGTVLLLNKEYSDFLESSGGVDPDFPGMDFSGGGKKVNGQNAALSEVNDDNTNDYGI